MIYCFSTDRCTLGIAPPRGSFSSSELPPWSKFILRGKLYSVHVAEDHSTTKEQHLSGCGLGTLKLLTVSSHRGWRGKSSGVLNLTQLGKCVSPVVAWHSWWVWRWQRAQEKRRLSCAHWPETTYLNPLVWRQMSCAMSWTAQINVLLLF